MIDCWHVQSAIKDSFFIFCYEIKRDHCFISANVYGCVCVVPCVYWVPMCHTWRADKSIKTMLSDWVIWWMLNVSRQLNCSIIYHNWNIEQIEYTHTHNMIGASNCRFLCKRANNNLKNLLQKKRLEKKRSYYFIWIIVLFTFSSSFFFILMKYYSVWKSNGA